jgi:hypothetical protein
MKDLLAYNGSELSGAGPFHQMNFPLLPASASARVCVKNPKFFNSMGQRHTFKAILIENLGIDLKFTSI